MSEKFTIRDAVEFAVRTEQHGQKVYQQFAERFADDPEVGEIFAQLARDEARHENQFRAILDAVPDAKGAATAEEGDGFLWAMSMSLFFIGDGKLIESAASIKDRTDALVRAFELEKATLQYYQALQENIGEHEALQQIIAAEREHATRVLRVLMADAEFRGLADDF